MASVLRNAAFLAVAKSFSVAVYALLGLVLPRFVPTDQVGVYTLMTTLLFFGSIITTFGIPTVVTRSVARAPADAAAVHAAARSATLLGWVLSTLVLATWLAVESWLVGSFEVTRWALFCAVVVILVSDGLAGLGEAVFQGFERMAAPAGIEIVTGTLRAGGAVACMVLLPEERRLPAIFGAFLLGSVVRAFLVARLMRRLPMGDAPPGSGSLWRALALVRESLFLALFRMLRMLRNRIDLLLLGVLFVGTVPGVVGDPDVARGIYGQAMRVALVFHVLTQALLTALWPRIARLTSDVGNEEDLTTQYRRTVRWQAWWAAPLAAGLFLYADVIAGWFGSEYLNGAPEAGVSIGSGEVMRILLVVVLLDCVSGPIGMLMMGIGRWERRLPAFGMVLAGTSVLLNVLFIPRWGILGAAYASLGACLVEVLVKAVILRSALGSSRLMAAALPCIALAMAMAWGLWALGLEARPFVGAALGGGAYLAGSLALRQVDPAVLRLLRRGFRRG
jgi:O-antigen/teichoic acid export membrane protein